ERSGREIAGGVDQHERHQARGSPAVGPRVAGPVLDHDVAGAELDIPSMTTTARPCASWPVTTRRTGRMSMATSPWAGGQHRRCVTPAPDPGDLHEWGCINSPRSRSFAARSIRMTYVIAEPCVDVKDRTCVDECPVDCIYEGERMLYIHPDECVD